MATKIRLQRHGRKGQAIYSIVIADERAKRDGRYIEKIGQYNPNKQPAIINLDTERALHWVQSGAVPTDTARAILSYKGVLLKKHLADGVKKGALTEEQADKKFQEWMDGKEAKIQGHADAVEKAKADAKAAALKAEAAANAKRAEEIAKANAPEPEEAAPAAEAATEEAPATETIDDAAAAAAGDDAPAAEAAEEKKD